MAKKKLSTNVPKPAKLGATEKQLMSAGRRELVKQQARAGKRLADQAASLRQRRMKEHHDALYAVQNKSAVNEAQRQRLMEVIGASTAAVLASEGVRVSMSLDGNSNGACYTDFRLIEVKHRVNLDDPEESAATVRGLIYHEGGHVRFTINPRDLLGMDFGRLQKIWNLLEDQRMESAVVYDSPRKASYFVPMVLSRVLSGAYSLTDNALAFGYLWVVQRRYLSRSLRRSMRKIFTDTYGITVTLEVERLSNLYCTSNDRQVMKDALVALNDVLINAGIIVPLTSGHQWLEKRAEGVEPQDVPQQPGTDTDLDIEHADSDFTGAESSEQDSPRSAEGDEQEDTETGNGTGSDGDSLDESEVPENGDGEAIDGNGGDETDDEDEDRSTSTDSPSDHLGSGISDQVDPKYQLFDEITDEINKARSERNNDTAVQRDIRTWNECRIGATLPTVPCTAINNNALRQRAENLALDMAEAFKAQFADRMPSWQENQTRGILNVNRWATRQPAEREFWRQWIEGDEPGSNFAVTLLLDRSGSMQWAETELSVAAYACKRACDELSIPCSVVLWESGAALLWGATDRATDLPFVASCGGTEPMKALRAVSSLRSNKPRHLVLMMTDGDWDGAYHVSSYVENEDRIIGLYFCPAGAYTNPLQTQQFHETHTINDLRQIPGHLRRILGEMA